MNPDRTFSTDVSAAFEKYFPGTAEASACDERFHLALVDRGNIRSIEYGLTDFSGNPLSANRLTVISGAPKELNVEPAEAARIFRHMEAVQRALEELGFAFDHSEVTPDHGYDMYAMRETAEAELDGVLAALKERLFAMVFSSSKD